MTKTRQDVTQPWKRELALSDLHTNAGQTGQGTDARTPEARGLARPPGRVQTASQGRELVAAPREELRAGSRGEGAPPHLLPCCHVRGTRLEATRSQRWGPRLGAPRAPGCRSPPLPRRSPRVCSWRLFHAVGKQVFPAHHRVMFPQERNTINRA